MSSPRRPADRTTGSDPSRAAWRPVLLSRPLALVRVIALAVAVLTTTGLVAPTSAQAALRTPFKPTAVRAVTSSASGFTVTAAPSRFARGYRVFASTTRSSLALATISRVHRSATAVRPRVTIGGLPYTTQPYYFRLQAVNGSKVRYSDVQVAYLRPDAPTGLRVSGRKSRGLALSWGGRLAGRYVITQATDAALTVNVRRYSITSLARTFTPYDLRRGARYWFAVRAYGGSAASASSNVVSAVAPSSGLNVRVMTYNLLHSDLDGKVPAPGAERIAHWVTARRAAAIALIRRANPDVMGLQEASDWVAQPRGPRRVDDLARRLGGYSVANTELTAGHPGWFRTGRYVVYRTARFRAVGAGGHWTLMAHRFAAYQQLQDRATGARFLAVSVHLEPGGGRAGDLRRKTQTENLLTFVRAFQARQDVPVIYLGDYNSNEGNAVDGPGLAFRAAGHVDSDEVAQIKVNRRYNSANQYRRLPMVGGYDVDHVYAPPGVAVRRWQIVLNLSAGRIVGTIPSDHNPVAVDAVLPY